MPMVGGWLGQRMMQFLVCRFLNTVRSCEFQESSSVFMSSRFFSGVILSPAPRVMLCRAPHQASRGRYAGTVANSVRIVLLFVVHRNRSASDDRQRHARSECGFGADGSIECYDG